MTTKLRTAFVAAYATAALVSPFALAGDEDDDKLCEVIGEAPNISVPPKDRLWFKENCICAGVAGCGKPSSARFGQRLAVAKQAAADEVVRRRMEREKAAAAQKTADEEATKRRKQAAAAKVAAEKKRLAIERKKQDELWPLVMARLRLDRSPGDRYTTCRTMAAGLSDTEDFCLGVEGGFRLSPEGKTALAEEAAQREREAAEFEQRLTATRAACLVLHRCLNQPDGHCIDAAARFRVACRDVGNTLLACLDNMKTCDAGSK